MNKHFVIVGEKYSAIDLEHENKQVLCIANERRAPTWIKSTSMPLALSREKDLILSINFKIVGYNHSFRQLVVSKLFEEKPLRAKDIFKKGFEKIANIRRFCNKGEDFENLRSGRR